MIPSFSPGKSLVFRRPDYISQATRDKRELVRCMEQRFHPPGELYAVGEDSWSSSEADFDSNLSPQLAFFSTLDSVESTMKTAKTEPGVGFVLWNRATEKLVAFNYGFAAMLPWVLRDPRWDSLPYWKSYESTQEIRHLAEATTLVAAGRSAFHEHRLTATCEQPLSIKIVAVQDLIVWIVAKIPQTNLVRSPVDPITDQSLTLALPLPTQQVPEEPSDGKTNVSQTPSPQKELVQVDPRPRKIRPWANAVTKFMLLDREPPETGKRRRK